MFYTKTRISTPYAREFTGIKEETTNNKILFKEIDGNAFKLRGMLRGIKDYFTDRQRVSRDELRAYPLSPEAPAPVTKKFETGIGDLLAAVKREDAEEGIKTNKSILIKSLSPVSAWNPNRTKKPVNRSTPVLFGQ
jgi:hypothetical protein